MDEGTVETRFYFVSLYLFAKHTMSESMRLDWEDLLFAALHELNEVREKHIPVSLTEAVDII